MSESTPEVTITTLANGPLEVSGLARVVDASGQTLREGDSLFLCRCGQSAKKPFCDGTHRKIGFSDGQDLPDGTGKS